MEQIGMSPDVGAIVGDVDRDVAHETDAALLTVGFQPLPLPEEFELPIPVCLNFACEFP